MADEVEQSLLWLRGNPPLPDIHPDSEARKNLLRQTEQFLRIEEEGDRHLAALHGQVKNFHAGMLELMIDMMRADTHKHMQVLKYIRKRLEAD
jgi:hypothetical protein